MSYKELFHTKTIALSNIRLTYIHISHNAAHIMCKPNSLKNLISHNFFYLAK